MTAPTGPSLRSRLILLAALAALAVAGVLVYRHSSAPPPGMDPPAPDLADVDPAIRGAIERARADVEHDRRSGTAWGRLGMAFYAHIFAPEAMTCFEQAERLDPDDPRWPYFQGLVLRATDPPAAIPKLRRAVELTGDRVDVPRLFLAEAYLQAGDPAEARPNFQAVVRIAPNHPRAHLGLARLDFEAGDLAGCREHLRYALPDRFTRKAALLLSAEAYQRAGDGAAARRDRAQAVGLPDAPNWPDPYADEMAQFQVGEVAGIRMAAQMLDNDSPRDAVGVLEGVVHDYPNSAGGWMTLGLARLNVGQPAAAEAALRRSLEIDPSQPRAWMGLAFTRLRQRDRAEAVRCLRKAAELKPSFLEAHLTLGMVLKEAGEPDAAAAAFEAALRCQPLSAPAHAQLGEVLLKRGRTDEAVAHLKQAVELNPNDAASKTLLEGVRK
jgi:cytochrome c-type biogenesis protein CcmH/NrfG